MINKKEIIKIAMNLVVIYLVGGFILVSAYAFTKPIIDQNDAAKKVVVLKKMIPGADKIEALGKWDICDRKADYFKVSKSSGELCGYVIESYGKGYSSFIHTMLAVDSSLKITNITILYHAETPGLGDAVTAPQWQKQFVGKSTDNMQVVKTSGTDKIQAISGATISSRAVVNAQRDALAFLSKALHKVAENSSTDTVQAVSSATPSEEPVANTQGDTSTTSSKASQK
jgi:Na+-translocating ferredoxin:NAD+ oxidoreductase subunit G